MSDKSDSNQADTRDGEESTRDERKTFVLPIYLGRTTYWTVQEVIEDHGYKITHVDDIPIGQVNMKYAVWNCEAVEITIEAENEEAAYAIRDHIAQAIPNDETHQRY